MLLVETLLFGLEDLPLARLEHSLADLLLVVRVFLGVGGLLGAHILH